MDTSILSPMIYTSSLLLVTAAGYYAGFMKGRDIGIQDTKKAFHAELERIVAEEIMNQMEREKERQE